MTIILNNLFTKKEPKLAYPIVDKPTKNREKTEKKYSTKKKKGKFWIKSGNKKKSQISNKQTNKKTNGQVPIKNMIIRTTQCLNVLHFNYQVVL